MSHCQFVSEQTDECPAVVIEGDGLLDEIVLKVTITAADNGEKVFHRNAILDTGANRTMVAPSVINGLGLEPVGVSEEMLTASGRVFADSYTVDICLGEKITLKNQRVYSIRWSESAENIIGMDVIRKGTLYMTNNDNKSLFRFCMPKHKKESP